LAPSPDYTGPPLCADAYAAGQSCSPVNDEKLSVVARNEAKPSPESRSVEDSHLHAPHSHSIQERSGSPAHADPIGNQSHRHASVGGTRQGGSKALAHHIIAQDVRLELDRSLRRIDEPDHGIECPVAVGIQRNGVPGRDIR
jgi:hypothetical protein